MIRTDTRLSVSCVPFSWSICTTCIFFSKFPFEKRIKHFFLFSIQEFSLSDKDNILKIISKLLNSFSHKLKVTKIFAKQENNFSLAF